MRRHRHQAGRGLRPTRAGPRAGDVQHLAPPDWERGDLDPGEAARLGTTLAQLQAAARQVVVAALDSALARLGRQRLEAVLNER